MSVATQHILSNGPTMRHEKDFIALLCLNINMCTLHCAQRSPDLTSKKQLLELAEVLRTYIDVVIAIPYKRFS